MQPPGGAESRPTVVAAVAALVLAGCAVLSLTASDVVALVSPDAEVGRTLPWLVGWVLLAWAALCGGVVLVGLVHAVVRRRRPALVETALAVATAALIAGAIYLHPVVGAGAGTG